jgi:hypothetical protein
MKKGNSDDIIKTEKQRIRLERAQGPQLSGEDKVSVPSDPNSHDDLIRAEKERIRAARYQGPELDLAGAPRMTTVEETSTFTIIVPSFCQLKRR